MDTVVVRSSNSIIYDPRVEKIVRSLRKKYSTLVLGWNREGVPREKINNYITDIKLFNLKTSIWKPSLIRMTARLVLFFPLFWIWILINLIAYRPRVVYACDLDTVIPCYIYKKIFRKKLIFDIFDRYAMAFIPLKYKIFYASINFLEELLSKESDALIIAGGELVSRTLQTKPKHFTVLMNCPEKEMINNRSSAAESNNKFTLVYTGGIRRCRSLETITEAIKDLNNVKLIVAGIVMDREVLNQMLCLPNVEYNGLVRPAEALALEASSDVIVALYDPKILWNTITLPNKLFEAMMCGVPIITNIAREIVNETKCGLIVEYDNIDQIKQAIIALRDDPDLHRRLGNNGRKAFLEKYNWSMMEKKLYSIYDNLSKD